LLTRLTASSLVADGANRPAIVRRLVAQEPIHHCGVKGILLALLVLALDKTQVPLPSSRDA
jgi:hypothetical protein